MTRMAAADAELEKEDFLWVLASLCALLRVPFDRALTVRRHPPPLTLGALHEAARALGLQTSSEQRGDVDWPILPMPCVAFLASDEAGMVRIAPVVIAKFDDDRLLCFRPGVDAPETMTLAEAAAGFLPGLIVVGPPEFEELGSGNPDDVADEKQAFGFRWFLPELLKHKSVWRDVLIASLCVQLVGLVTPLFTQVIIDKVVAHQARSTLWVLAVGLAMFMGFTAVMTWLRQYLVLHTGNRIDAVLGAQSFRHLLHLPLPWFEHRPTGTLVARLHGVETIREFVSGAAVTLMLDLPFLLIFLAVMFAYSWQLSLIAIGLLGLICLMSVLVVPVFRERLNRQFMLGARSQSFLTEYIAGISTVKSLQMEAHVEQRYGQLLSAYLAAGFSTKQVGNSYGVAANTAEQAMTLGILIFGATLVMQNDGFTVGMLVAFQMFAGRMSQPLLRLVGLWQEFQQADIAVKRLGDIFDMPMEPHIANPSRVQGEQGMIDLVELSFRYSEHHPWLYRTFSLRFMPGHLTVLMGPSGSGKSTLAKLLLGFYQPSEGLIRLDGRDIRHLAANELREAFGVVPQETTLFSGTIYDNLMMAHPHATFDDVVAACKAAEIHDTIDALPDGYQTELGERGIGLSGGQRQRIAIARALLKRPRVLIFDEAVSNLDQQTAEHFSQTVNRLKGRVTIIFITHQIPKGLHVDEVVTLPGATRLELVQEERG